MLTFKQYCKQFGMNEAFLDAIKYNGDMLEMFVNPTPKEWRDINVNHNVRWVADMDNQKLYAWNGELGIHSPVLQKFKPKHPELKLTYSDDWVKHVGYLGSWIAGNTERNTHENIDTYDWIQGLMYGMKPGKPRDTIRQECIDELEELLKKDFNWINKYGPKGELIKENAVRFLHYVNTKITTT
jgi:hypothetical protein